MSKQLSAIAPGHLVNWVDRVAALTTPAGIHRCDGSDAEWQMLTRKLEASGTLRRRRIHTDYARFGDRLPIELRQQLTSRVERLSVQA